MPESSQKPGFDAPEEEGGKHLSVPVIEGGRCEQCRHWHELTEDYGECERFPGMEGASLEDSPVPFFDLATSFYTPPGFGCKRFETKNTRGVG
jgi:hypothetical protein